jgi:hypothetical protein
MVCSVLLVGISGERIERSFADNYSVYTQHLHSSPSSSNPTSISTKLYLDYHRRRILDVADQYTGHVVSWVTPTFAVLRGFRRNEDS